MTVIKQINSLLQISKDNRNINKAVEDTKRHTEALTEMMLLAIINTINNKESS